MSDTEFDQAKEDDSISARDDERKQSEVSEAQIKNAASHQFNANATPFS